MFPLSTASLHCIQHRQMDDVNCVHVSLEDMRYAMDLIQPSAMREVQLEVPKVDNSVDLLL